MTIRNEIQEIKSLPRTSDGSINCEGQIRMIDERISAFHDIELKNQLLYELKSVSCRGLSDDLRQMMEQRGLAFEGLTLVLKYLTTVPDLAEYLYVTSNDILKGGGLEIIKRKLGPSLEVLGGLKAKGIDVRKLWVQRLTKKAPSLHSLSRLSSKEIESLCKKPSESGKSRGSRKPSQSVNSTESRKPLVSGNSTDSGKAPEPGKSMESGNTVESGKPVESGKTVESGKSTESGKPSELENSSESGKTEESGEEASKGEMEEVRRLVKVAEAYSRQTSALPPDLQKSKVNADAKAIDEKKLKKAKELMNEAKQMASQQSEQAKTAAKKKMDEMMKALELPADWNQQGDVTPDQLFQQLDGIIDQYSSIVEAGESYKSDLEVVAKASGGRALCGIYHSEYEPPRTAGRPILLMPANVTLTNPNDSMKIRYMKFSESRAAANYVHTVKSSSTSVGFSVSGYFGGFTGEVKGAYASETNRNETRSTKTLTTSASVLQYIWTAKKCFHLEEEQMKLSEGPVSMAKSLASVSDPTSKEETARRFMEIFGSHIPAGVQTLGGVFFSIADAESEEVQTTTELTKATATQLQAQCSASYSGGVFGFAASVNTEHQNASGKVNADQIDHKKNSYTFSLDTIGPAATNPVMFQKLLSYNSTWALIDRGPPQAYVPVWKLVSELGSEFKEAATVLEKTWRDDEESKKTTWKDRMEIERVKRRKEDVNDELTKLRDDYVKQVCDKIFS